MLLLLLLLLLLRRLQVYNNTPTRVCEFIVDNQDLVGRRKRRRPTLCAGVATREGRYSPTSGRAL